MKHKRDKYEDAAAVMPVAVRRAFNITEPSAAAGTNAAISPLVYSIGQSATLLGVSRATVSRLLSEGALPAIRLGARTLIRRADLEKLLNELTTNSVPEAIADRGRRVRAARERLRSNPEMKPPASGR